MAAAVEKIIDPSTKLRPDLGDASAHDYYCCTAPKPPKRQDLQIPKPLPLVCIAMHRFVRRPNSAGLKVADVKGVSVLP